MDARELIMNGILSLSVGVTCGRRTGPIDARGPRMLFLMGIHGPLQPEKCMCG